MENIISEPALQYNFISPATYLELERAATEKHEYYHGEIFAMSGASLAHTKIFSNVFGDISYKLKGKKCQPFGSDLRIHIPKNTLYTYPDISIICGDPELTDEHFDTATNPAVIIELLSKSSRNTDTVHKFTLYRDIESLQEYILVDTEKIHIEKHIRHADNSWQLTDYKLLTDSFSIDTVQIIMNLQDVYEGLNLYNDLG